MKKSRLAFLLTSAVLIGLLVTGGILSHAVAREGSFQYLRVFQDVVSLILNNSV